MREDIFYQQVALSEQDATELATLDYESMKSGDESKITKEKEARLLELRRKRRPLSAL